MIARDSGGGRMQDGRALARIGAAEPPAGEGAGGALAAASSSAAPPPATSRSAASGPAAPVALDGRAKAAIVVRLLLREGADLPLENLPEELQATLVRQMGQMGLVDRETLAAVVREFAEALEGAALTFPGSLEGAVSELEDRISASAAARLRQEAGLRERDDPWQRLRALPAEELARLASGESVEVAAVLLSKLDTGRAAELLERLPGPLARRIALAVSRTGNVTPRTVERIGAALAARAEARPPRAFEDEPGERVGEILNLSPPATRDELLEALEQSDAEFAGSVRRALFTFAHIPARIVPRDVPKVVRAADPDQLVRAIAYATEGENRAAVEFLLSNMSSRMADALREDAAERGTVRPREGEAALTAVVAAIRELQQAGEITLRDPDEEENG